MRSRRPNAKMMALQVENWNLKHPVGTLVAVARDDGSTHVGKTRSGAYILSGHSAVIHVEGISGCYLLDRVTPCEAQS